MVKVKVMHNHHTSLQIHTNKMNTSWCYVHVAMWQSCIHVLLMVFWQVVIVFVRRAFGKVLNYNNMPRTLWEKSIIIQHIIPLHNINDRHQTHFRFPDNKWQHSIGNMHTRIMACLRMKWLSLHNNELYYTLYPVVKVI